MITRTTAWRWRVTALVTLTGVAVTSGVLAQVGTAAPNDGSADAERTVAAWWDAAPQAPGTLVEVIVRGSDRVPTIDASVGGTVTAELPLVAGYAAVVPHDRLAELAESAAVTAVTPDESLRLLGDEAGWDDETEGLTGTEAGPINLAAVMFDDQFEQLAALASGDDHLLEDLRTVADRRTEEVVKAEVEYRERVAKTDFEAAEDFAKREEERTRKLDEAETPSPHVTSSDTERTWPASSLDATAAPPSMRLARPTSSSAWHPAHAS